MQRGRVEQVYQQIREGIIKGELAPSERLVEAQLAQRYKVGRHIVRLALERLDAEGLVTIEANRGATVTRLSLEEAVDILLAREVLEGAAARLAATRINDAQLQSLRELVKEMERAIEDGEYDRYSDCNKRFHEVIYEACGSRKIPELISSLRARVVRFQFRTVLVPGRADQSLEEHRAVLGTLEARDAEGAERAMRTHVATLRDTLTRAWELLRN